MPNNCCPFCGSDLKVEVTRDQSGNVIHEEETCTNDFCYSHDDEFCQMWP